MLIKQHIDRDGFTIVELLLGLAITAMLLTAIAVAFEASTVNYRLNRDIFRTTNKARQALVRMTNQLRSANAVDPNENAYRCSLITKDSEDITYEYNSSDNKLYLITNDDLSDDDYVLCDNVSAVTFAKSTDSQGGVVYVRSVQISMTVESDNAQKTLSTAVAVRKNLD